MARDVEYLLIGGGFACAVAASALRSEGAMGQIVIISAENELPYFRPVLPKMFIEGKISHDKAAVYPEEFYKQNNIELIFKTKVQALDPQSKLITTDNAGDFHFHKLLIATGCETKPITLPGSDLAGIYHLYTFDDAQAIINELTSAKKAVIIGGNSISIELASSLVQKGLQVTIIDHDFILFNVYPFENPKSYLEQHGVEVIFEKDITRLNGNKKVESIETSSGKTIPCDFVVFAAHREPAIEFLRDSGIKTNKGVVVDKYLQTNFEKIYAAGDVAEFYDPLFDKYRRVEGTDNAAKQAKIAALNMIGDRTCYRMVSYCFFSAFDSSFVIIGDAAATNETIVRGTNEKCFAILYLLDDILKAAFFCGRPVSEIKATESLIANQIDLSTYKDKLKDSSFAIEPLATQNILTLQGGGALGAFECGVVKAMEEQQIYPDIVAGISIGAFNSAIIASNPKNATQALEAFWDELAVDTICTPDEQTRRILSSWQSIIWGTPKFFHPRWLMPVENMENLPINWTSFYDPSSIKDLLCKYVDFNTLKDSPVRLLVMAVNVETCEFETFDSYTDDITPDHILASGSLPPGFPWTTINGKHYWDGGIVTNTPIDSALEICGTSGKKIYIVELYPRRRPLPKNMLDVITRKDEVLLSEKIRKGIREREAIEKYRKLVEIILRLSPQDVVEEVEQLPIYIQTMGDPGLLHTTRIIREMQKDEPYSWDSDFSRSTIEQLQICGYAAAKKSLDKQ